MKRFESEIALAIWDKAEDVAEDVAGLTSILEYDLRPGRSHRITDTYYDTVRGSLRTQRITCRVRRIDGRLYLSTKSDPTQIIGKGIRRREIEVPWSRPSLLYILRELKLKPLDSRITEFAKLTPSRVFAASGLVRTQRRLTKRQTRDVLLHRKRGARSFAELDIDDVTYQLNGRRIRLLELEIEAKARRALPRIRRITDELESLYPDSLREWAHGKFVTGLAIQRLLTQGRLQNLLHHDLLTPDAFVAIDHTIRTTNL